MPEEHHTNRLIDTDFQGPFDLLPLMYFVVGEDGNILAVNRTALHILGYQREELLGIPVFGIFTPEDREHVRRQITNTPRDQHVTAQWECRKTRKDGTTFWVRETARPAKRSDGSYVFHIMCEDITGQKQMMEQYRYAEARYRSLVENVPAISYAVDLAPPPRTTFISPQVEFLLGYKSDEWLSDPSFWRECIHPDDRDRVVEEVLRNNESGAPFFLEYRVRTKTGSYSWIRNHGVYLRDENGKPRHTHGVMIDITDTKRIEQREQEVQARLARAERMESLGLLAGGVAHDLNNILGPLVAYPDLVLKEVPPDSESARDLTMMRDAAIRAADVIQDLLTLSRRGHVPREPVDLNVVLRSYLSAPTYLDLQKQYPQVSVDTQLTDQLPRVLGAHSQLLQVVMNLFMNAFEAIGKGAGRITIGTRCEQVDRMALQYDTIEAGEYVVLRIEDTGCGIAPEDLEHIFEPFYTRKSLGRSGSGLGLSIVYGIVKDMDGYMHLQSRIGRGTSFTVYFPLSTARAPAQSSAAARELTGHEKILVVDDMPEQLEMAQRLLTNLGYHVSLAGGYDAALAAIAAESFDLVLLDMVVENGPDGLNIYKAILNRVPHQRCVVISGFAETDRVRDTLDLGAHAYVRKPYTMEKLGAAVRAALDVRAGH